MRSMKTTWQYKHIIDLEYFCHQDVDVDNDTLHQRDRKIFLENKDQFGSEQSPANRRWIWAWLTKRMQQDFPTPEQKSPGTIFRDGYFMAKSLAVIIGIVVGLTGGFSFFTYTGTTPVNVFHFLLLFVVSQLALVSLLLTALLIRSLLPGLQAPSFYALLLRRMISRSMAFFHKQWLRTAAADKRVSVNHALGIFKARSTIYGSLFYWPVFVLCQLFAIGFNIGLLAATLIKISTSDIAFGWQSTMQFSAEAIHRFVMLAAMPWSWFVSQANSFPTLAEIEGSRIILKEGIYHLTTSDLIAWWPFLVFCLLFYGLLVRLILFLVGKIMERRSLHNLKLDTPACLALIRRMQTPLVTTQAAPEPKKIEPTGNPGFMHQAPEGTAPHLLKQVVLIPDDIYPLCPTEKMEPLLQQKGFTIKERHRFMVSYDTDQQLKHRLAERTWQPGEGIFILMEGWMVPLVDFLSYLKELRTILPDNTIIHLGLVGRPDATVFTPAAPTDLTLWRQKIEALGDPYLSIFSLIS
ncbi:DUF2868 domain-containing protein [Desulfopila sp. IMCC35006]|nr:DUF2868 domain-containing protein [Desulfopila sp. IMCC35006]